MSFLPRRCKFVWRKVAVDIVINLSASNPAEYNHGKPATEVSLEQFMIPPYREKYPSQLVQCDIWDNLYQSCF